MPQLSAEGELILRVLRAAPGTLSRKQISTLVGIDEYRVDDTLLILQIHGLVHCEEGPRRPRDRPRTRTVLWKAARPDLA